MIQNFVTREQFWAKGGFVMNVMMCVVMSGCFAESDIADNTSQTKPLTIY